VYIYESLTKNTQAA